MKHLKLFKTSKDLQDFKDGKDYITPYLYYQEQSNEIGVNQESVPNNEIWYTYRKSVFINNGGDGGNEEYALEAIQPKSKRILGNSEEHTYIPQGPLTFNPNAFNANIVSDDFIDGHGVITFDDDVTIVGDYAFSSCNNLLSITLPQTVTEIGEYAFAYSYSLADVVIPNSVTSISDYAFYNCSSLTGITIPDSVTSINNSTFYNCSSLTGITIPDSVTSISINAFMQCSNLTTVEIGSGVTSIGTQAFSNCSSLKEITCHANTAPSISSNTFSNIATYGLLIYPEGSDYSSWLSTNSYYLGYYSWGTGFGKIKCTYNITSTNTPTKICKSTNGIYKMEVDGVKIAPTSAYTFNETGEHVIEFTSLNNIPSSIFYNCSNLTNAEIGSECTSIGNYVFEGCSNLTTVEIGSGVTSIKSYVFEDCSSLKEITCHAITAPSINSNTFRDIASYGLLTHPEGSDYSSWLSTSSYYLGYYNWSNKVVGVICTYNITSANTPTNICYSTNGILKMEVDGVEIEPTTAYTFNEIGEHIIEFTFLNNIASNAFYYCSNLTTVEIGSGCTSIGPKAFLHCDGLTGITIPNSVTSIGDSAFYYCYGLTEITIPDSVTSIGDSAFNCCYELTGITIPDSVTSIGIYAFAGCSNLNIINVSTGNTVYDSRENCNAIIETATNTLIQGCNTTVIPDSVTSIGNNAFEDCSGLTGITIPDSVASIGNNAFYNCDGLTGITIPASVTSIGEFAFYSCDGLTSITMPDSLTNIGKYAFKNCINLTTVEIGSGCTSIGIYAFSDCPKLKKITCHANTAPSISQSTFRDVAYYGLLIHPEGSNYNRWLSAGTYYLGYYSWGDGIGEIKCTYNITSIDEPTRICNYTSGVLKMEVDGVEIEPTSAYTFNETGEHVVEFDYLNKMRIRAFSNCSSLTNVEIDGERISIGDSAFTNCNGLTTVEIGDGCTSIGSSVFYNCSNLKTVEIGSGVTSVGDYAFQSCSKLKEITCHANTAPSISTSTFNGIANYGLLTHPEGSDYSSWLSTNNLGYYNWVSRQIGVQLPELTLDDYDVALLVYAASSSVTKICSATTNISEIKVNDTVLDTVTTGYTFSEPYTWNVVRFKFKNNTTISASTFSNMLMYEVNMSDIIENIDSYAFYKCTKLKTINISDNIKKIGYSSFQNCSSLTGITIPDSVTSIGNNAFYNCDGLTGITIPDSVTSIGTYAFQSCSNLTNVEIGSGCTSIGPQAFRNCSNLTGITIPDSVTRISEGAFRDCTSLTGITIPDSVTSIDDNAFYYCSGLTGITIPDSVTSIGISAFAGCSNLNIINVSTGNTVYDSRENCNAIIKTATNTLIQGCNTTVIPNSVTSIGDYAFESCSNLTGITIPDSVTRISEGAFRDCTSLTGITIPDSVTSIGEHAFRDCTSLTGITIPDSVTYIGNSTFSSCLSLTGITIPDSVTYIGNYAFSDCNGLTGITIPDSVTSISNSTFNNCSGLTAVEIGSGCTSIGNNAFGYCKGLTGITIPESVATIGASAFTNCNNLKNIICQASVAPSILSSTFYNVASNGNLYYPQGGDYSNWLSTNSYYLGYYGWTGDALYEPQTYYDLEITAADVDGRATTTIITWRCLSDGIDTLTNEIITGVELTGTAISNTFEQNTSETDVIERTITFEYQGMTASTVITQGVWINQYYALNLNNQWQESTKPNPDSTLYDGVYESFSNKGKDNTAAIMYIDIVGYENFSLYIRSYAESNYDYVMVSQLDKTINNSSSYSNTTLVKAHTRGNQQSGTALSNYKLVEFTGIDGGEHRITVVYRKDGSSASGDDKGYILIPKNQ